MAGSHEQSGSVPRHVAIIMDGNGRWAEARGHERNAGHREGLESVRTVTRAAKEVGIQVLTLYAFSLENWNRPQAEVAELMRLLDRYIDEELPEIHENGIRVRALGRLDRLAPSLRKKIDHAMQLTEENREMTLALGLSYGGRQEIVDAARALMRDAEAGKIAPDDLDEKTFTAYLYAPDLPDPDLLIRTGSEYRVSNFLLWQIAYSELYTTDVMWPEFGREDLEEAIAVFQRRERRFGMTSAQVRGGDPS